MLSAQSRKRTHIQHLNIVDFLYDIPQGRTRITQLFVQYTCPSQQCKDCEKESLWQQISSSPTNYTMLAVQYNGFGLQDGWAQFHGTFHGN